MVKNTCPPGFVYYKITHSCYFPVPSIILNQKAAVTHCQSYGSDVHLVAIQSPEEHDHVKSLAMAFGMNFGFPQVQ